MNKLKINVVPKKSISEMICLAPTKDTELENGQVLEKDIPFWSVTPELFKSMKKPKSVEVYFVTGLLFCDAII